MSADSLVIRDIMDLHERLEKAIKKVIDKMHRKKPAWWSLAHGHSWANAKRIQWREVLRRKR